jgi:molecular chaperone DnaK
MRVLGIDFGTSNTVAMVRTADARMRPLLFDGSPLLPSAVYVNTDGKVLVGRDAERNARVDPARFEPNPKRRIDDGEVFVAGQVLPVPQIFGYVLSQVNTEARRQLGGAPQEVRLTHPARWGERRRSLLVEAARRAGLVGASVTPQLIPEPVGAASYFTAVLGSTVPVGRSLAIYDLGGGTFDATVVRRTRTGFEVLAEDGLADVGGLDFDHAIVEYLGKAYGQSHPAEWASLVAPADPNDRRLRRMLYEDVRGAKEMLSRTASADIHLPALEVDAHLTREELESLVRPYLERTVACLRRAIESARLTPHDLVGIFLVGGSSRIPLAAHLIHSELGVAPTTLEQPETVVVEGALCIGAKATPIRTSGTPRQVTPQAPAAPPRRQGPPVPARPASAVPVSPSPMSGVPIVGAVAAPGTTPHPPLTGTPSHPLAPGGAGTPSRPLAAGAPSHPLAAGGAGGPNRAGGPGGVGTPGNAGRPPGATTRPPVTAQPVGQPLPQQQLPQQQMPPRQSPAAPAQSGPPVQAGLPAQSGPPVGARPAGWQPSLPQPAPQPVRNGPFPPQVAPPPPVLATPPDRSERRWAGGTIAVLILVAIGFAVLLIVAFSR